MDYSINLHCIKQLANELAEILNSPPKRQNVQAISVEGIGDPFKVIALQLVAEIRKDGESLTDERVQVGSKPYETTRFEAKTDFLNYWITYRLNESIPNPVAFEVAQIFYNWLQDDAMILVLFNRTDVDFTDFGLDVFDDSGEADRQGLPLPVNKTYVHNMRDGLRSISHACAEVTHKNLTVLRLSGPIVWDGQTKTANPDDSDYDSEVFQNTFEHLNTSIFVTMRQIPWLRNMLDADFVTAYSYQDILYATYHVYPGNDYFQENTQVKLEEMTHYLERNRNGFAANTDAGRELV